MSKGFGKMQMCLLSVIGERPMSFEQILTAISPDTFDGDDDIVGKLVRSPDFSPTRSLRRALATLVDRGVIQIVGRRPHQYRLHPFFGTCEHNPEQVRLLYQIVKVEVHEGNPLVPIPEELVRGLTGRET
jgi:hypothetical protein